MLTFQNGGYRTPSTPPPGIYHKKMATDITRTSAKVEAGSLTSASLDISTDGPLGAGAVFDGPSAGG